MSSWHHPPATICACASSPLLSPDRSSLPLPFLPPLCVIILQWNDGEAQVVMQHVQRLMAAGIKASDIGVITPYSAQVGHTG